MWVGSEFQAAGPATTNEPSAKCVLVRRTVKSRRTDDRRGGGRCIGCTNRSSTRAPFRGKRRTSERIVCSTLCVRKSEANVGGAAVVQRDYELVLSKPDERHCPGFAAFSCGQPRCSSPTVRCSSPNVLYTRAVRRRAAAAADRMSASRWRRFRDVFSHVVHQLYVARFL